MKRLLICGIAAATFFSANAQVDFGAKAGLNVSNYAGADASTSGSNGTANSAKTGLLTGVVSDIKLTGSLHLKPELVYSMQGNKEDYYLNNTVFSVATIKAAYLNLPVMLAYQFKNGVFLQTGPQIGFLLSARSEINAHETDVKDQFKKVDFSWGFGAGYKLAKNVAVDLRYNLGLNKVAKDGSKIYNNVLQIGVAYYFNKK